MAQLGKWVCREGVVPQFKSVLRSVNRRKRAVCTGSFFTMHPKHSFIFTAQTEIELSFKSNWKSPPGSDAAAD